MSESARASASPLSAWLSPEELRALHRLEPWKVAGRIALEWALILAALALWAATREPAVFVLAWLVIGTRQHALINLVHDAVHYNLARSRATNDWISDVFCATPVLLETTSHRRGHLPHHVHLGEAAHDTERRIWINLRGRRLLWLLLQHLCGWTMVRAVRSYAERTASGDRPPIARYLGLVAASNGLILLYCWLLGAPLAWLYLWIYPLFSLALLLVSLLAIAQHQPVAYSRLGRDDPSVDLRPALTRDAIGSPVERFVFASIGAAYHREHHLVPGVPHTRLRRLHALLRERGFYGDRGGELRRSYAGVLADLVRARSEPPASGPRALAS